MVTDKSFYLQVSITDVNSHLASSYEICYAAFTDFLPILLYFVLILVILLLVRYDASECSVVTDLSQQRRILKRR